MGSFGTYEGTMGIEKDEKKQFVEQMLKILYYGGMMSFEEVKLYGDTIRLIKPVRKSTKKKISFYYNYFEDDSWESAEFDTESTVLWSGKKGSAEFSDVLMTAYSLYEVYDKNNGVPIEDGDIIDSTEYIGWINHILKTDFSMKKRFRLWKNVEREMLAARERGDMDNLTWNRVMSYIPYELREAAGGIELADVLYIVLGTSTLTEEEVEKGTYPYDVYCCKKALWKWLDVNENDDILWELLKKNYKERELIGEKELKIIAQSTLILPARVIVYLFSEWKEEDFWENWRKVKENVYCDEKMKEYASDELKEWRKNMQERAIEPVQTNDFLRQNAPWAFWNTPDELKKEPECYISDDDRLFWWDGTDEVMISDEADDWLKELGKQYKEIMEAEDEWVNGNGMFIDRFFEILKEADDYYKHIYPFKSMFYEFMENGNKKKYRAAVDLLEKVVDNEDNRKSGEVIKYASNGYWDITSRKVTHNRGRLNVKRYLSVMANLELRKRYFDF